MMLIRRMLRVQHEDTSRGGGVVLGGVPEAYVVLLKKAQSSLVCYTDCIIGQKIQESEVRKL